MALARLRRPENVRGDFFVDSSCIDCDLCRQIAPATFHQAGDQTAVYAQPTDPETEFAALKALVTCPTASIGDLSRRPAQKAVQAFPEQIEDDVYFCGFASESSFGASSYLIRRASGNVLVDSPRFAKPLVKKIEELGGIDLIFLTHRDDVADHDLWAKHFEAKRIMHADDAGRLKPVIEKLINGQETIALDEDLLIIPTPGHTRGHMVLLYRNRFLFTGDHLWWSPAYQSLNASRGVCWYSWPHQVESIKRLQNYNFEWVLPGHGWRAHGSPVDMQNYLAEFIGRINS
jgi:glyoxylase-like metal-dependent hydrolase (beta-lactamase superfamily II)/ferredoxin